MTPNIMEVKRCLLKLGHDIRFEEIVKVMKEYGYEIKQPKGGSSHYSFVKSGCNRIVIPRHKPAKISLTTAGNLLEIFPVSLCVA